MDYKSHCTSGAPCGQRQRHPACMSLPLLWPTWISQARVSACLNVCFTHYWHDAIRPARLARLARLFRVPQQTGSWRECCFSGSVSRRDVLHYNCDCHPMGQPASLVHLVTEVPSKCDQVTSGALQGEGGSMHGAACCQMPLSSLLHWGCCCSLLLQSRRRLCHVTTHVCQLLGDGQQLGLGVCCLLLELIQGCLILLYLCLERQLERLPGLRGSITHGTEPP